MNLEHYLMGVFRKSKKQPLWKGVVLGITGGLAGSWLMNQSQNFIEKVATPRDGGDSGGQQAEPATLRTAEKLSESVTGAPLPREQKKIAEPAVHYAFGALVGAVYGGIAARVPLVTLGIGTIYGVAVWLLADEVAVPALGLSKPPKETPLTKHLQALGAHLVYGLTTEGVRRAGSKLAF
jgi:hypothetical protein